MIFNQKIHIANKEISSESSVFVIAEAGVNHGGDMALARKLVDNAVKAGADAVKFQAFRTDHLIIDKVEKAPYQQASTGNEETQSDMLRKLELQKEQYIDLKNYCAKKNIIFLITPFDEKSLAELEDIGVDAYKVASTDATNLPFLKKIAKTGKPVIFSSGMCFLEEVDAAMDELGRYNKNVILLHCTANYPIEDNEVNLNVLNTYRSRYDAILGYSDHSKGLGAALYAIPMGAKVVEKHFTLDKSLDGPDHQASLDPEELADFVNEVRKVETFLGSSVKEPTSSELSTRKSLQKCFVAAREIKKGEVLSEDNIIAKRTGGIGISPLMYRRLYGLKTAKAYKINDVIEVDIK